MAIGPRRFRLSRLLLRLFRGDPEMLGLNALLLLQHARAPARLDAEGQIVLMEDQDRRLWRRELIAEAFALLDKAVRLQNPGPYQIQAAIAAVRAVKSPDEIAKLEFAARGTHQAVLDAMAESRLGDTEKEMANRISKGIIDNGADTVAVGVARGPRRGSAQPPSPPPTPPPVQRHGPQALRHKQFTVFHEFPRQQAAERLGQVVDRVGRPRVGGLASRWRTDDAHETRMGLGDRGDGVAGRRRRPGARGL
mgnify:CR=1 FL=1